MARFTSVIVFFLSLLSLSIGDGFVPPTDYDVIIVGGGPAGLSAMSALCRVSRRAILFDTAEYRNNVTRNMHDVIGADGAVPHEFRQAVRDQIDKYQLATWARKKVVAIKSIPVNGYPAFRVIDADGKSYTGRRVILATGVTDILPDIPGSQDAYGKGMYWCPWCDGFEHRGQTMGVLGPLSDALSSVVEMHNINPEAIVLTDGTDTPAERAEATKRSATWQAQLKAYNVPIVNNTIERIERLRDDNDHRKHPGHDSTSCNSVPRRGGQQQQVLDSPDVIPTDPNAGPNGKHYDLFRFHFKGRDPIDREAILLNCPVKQTAVLHEYLNLAMDGPKVKVDAKTQASIEGVFAVGDMNNEGATNVPHAMYNGKKAAVVAHVQLAKEESKASITKRSISFISEMQHEKHTFEEIGNELDIIWENIKVQFGRLGEGIMQFN